MFGYRGWTCYSNTKNGNKNNYYTTKLCSFAYTFGVNDKTTIFRVKIIK